MNDVEREPGTPNAPRTAHTGHPRVPHGLHGPSARTLGAVQRGERAKPRKRHRAIVRKRYSAMMREGVLQSDILEDMASRGIVNRRTGRPYDKSSVTYVLQGDFCNDEIINTFCRLTKSSRKRLFPKCSGEADGFFDTDAGGEESEAENEAENED